MTKQEIQKNLEDVDKAQEVLCKRMEELEKKASAEFMKRINDFFSPLLKVCPEIYLQKCWNGVYFKRKAEEVAYGKELVTLSYSDSYNRLELNTYSTIVHTDWELERLMFVGELAEVVKRDKEGVIAALTYEGEDAEERKALQSAYYELEKQIRGFKEQLRQLEAIEYFNKLQYEGLEFEKPRAIRVRFDHVMRDVVKLKVLKYTSSGNSATVLFTTKREKYRWDNKEYKNIYEGVEYPEYTYDRVKVENLKNLTD